MREVHVLNHHRFNDGPGDITSTEGRETGMRAVWYSIRYGCVVKTTGTNDFRSRCVGPRRRKRRHQFILDITLVMALIG